MQEKTEHTLGNLSFNNTPMWRYSNLFTNALITSAVIIPLQQGFKTGIINYTTNGAFVPPISSYSGGILNLTRLFFSQGFTSAATTGAVIRCGYVTSMRDQEKTITPPDRTQYQSIALLTFGDLLLTQPSESLAQLRKVPGLLPPNFKWHNPHNLYKLVIGGFVPRYISGLIHFTMMLRWENEVAACLPIKDNAHKHALAGSLTGMSSAFFSYPFTAIKDRCLVETKLSHDGKLINKSVRSLLQETIQNIKENPWQTIAKLPQQHYQLLIARMLFSSLLFSAITTTQTCLNPEPLAVFIPKPQPPNPPKNQNKHSWFATKVSKVSQNDDFPENINSPF